jgi:hypothetical protein
MHRRHTTARKSLEDQITACAARDHGEIVARRTSTMSTRASSIALAEDARRRAAASAR